MDRSVGRVFVDGSTRRLDGLFGSNGRRALLFLHWSRQGIQVEKTLLSGSAEAFLRKQESKSLWAHLEQYFVSILLQL
jgi:hypothetical protein